MPQLTEMRLAVLIDADNAPRNSIGDIMAEIAVYGTPTIKRTYGDWTAPNMAGWKSILLENAFTPIQQYAYTTGKNATDSAMIIDAMDILYTGHIDGFCLVSSDSDFTRLATRLREAGMKVIGIGEKKTPSPFIVACDKFIYVEIIRAAAAGKEPASLKSRVKVKKKAEAAPMENANGHNDNGHVPASMISLIASSVADIADEDGFAFMGELGNLLIKKQPDFDPRNYGFQKLTQLIKSLDRFEIDVRQTNSPHIKHIFLRDKQSKPEDD
ncbi:MAG: NYN domain-containing protein [Oscillospiraceae bacterium]|nr:NYN domain-containing protein [Oscillospiraceae bacterium]